MTKVESMEDRADRLAEIALDMAERVRSELPEDVADWLMSITDERDRFDLLFVAVAPLQRNRRRGRGDAGVQRGVSAAEPEGAGGGGDQVDVAGGVGEADQRAVADLESSGVPAAGRGVTQFPKARPSTGPRQPRGPRPLRTHAIHGDTTDWDGVSVCSDCGFRADHRVHAVEVSAEATEIDARRLGEAPDG